MAKLPSPFDAARVTPAPSDSTPQGIPWFRPGASSTPTPRATPAPDDHPARAAADIPQPRPTPELARAPGLVGDLADYFFGVSIKPVREVALISALAFVAGIAGRQWNTNTGAGLNLYLILVAKTGVGKEGGRRAISRVLRAVRDRVPRIQEFVGPTRFASGPALMNWLQGNACFYSWIGEIGLLLKRLASPTAPSHEQSLKQALLDVYSQSGQDGVVGVGAYSEREKSTAIVHAPSVTLVGESVPDVFFGCLEQALVQSGLVPRLVVVEYRGGRPPTNPNTALTPPSDLVQRVADLAEAALRLQDDGKFVLVDHHDAAKALFAEFDQEVDALINSAPTDGHAEVWNRAHLHALKIGTLLAVGCNPSAPLVTAEQARWAVAFVRQSAAALLSKFEQGEAGGSDLTRAEVQIRKRVLEFLGMPPEQRAHERYGIKPEMRNGPCLPRNYLVRRLRDVQPFKSNPQLLDRALDDMVKNDVLQRLDKRLAWMRFKTNGDVYAPGPNWS